MTICVPTGNFFCRIFEKKKLVVKNVSTFLIEKRKEKKGGGNKFADPRVAITSATRWTGIKLKVAYISANRRATTRKKLNDPLHNGVGDFFFYLYCDPLSKTRTGMSQNVPDHLDLLPLFLVHQFSVDDGIQPGVGTSLSETDKI